MGSFSTAALLYAGAALIGAVLRQPISREARVQGSDVSRLLLMAIFGAGIGPVALAWGLQHTSGTSASLMLTMEAVFTAVLARLWYHETLDRRVTLAMGMLTLGGMVLVLDRSEAGTSQVIGLIAVLAATACMGRGQHPLARPVGTRSRPGRHAQRRDRRCGDGIAGLRLSVNLYRDCCPALGLLLVGATGYGLSLRFYLLAQRSFGAARTGSVFAFAPFVGALLAVVLGERAGSWWMLAGAVLMIAGILIHLVERHGHEHQHDEMEHEHAHTHDDGHHEHFHDPMPVGPHSHRHRHLPLRHTHSHVPDQHHAHRH